MVTPATGDRRAGYGAAAADRQAELWEGFFARHFSGTTRALAERIFANSGVITRQAAVNPLLEDVSDWSTERRMRRYLVEALPLGKEAVDRALTEAGLAARRASGCSWSAPAPGTRPRGWTSCWPGTWAWPPDTQRLFVGHMGCYAALPGLGAVSDFVAARGRPALLLCAELTSLHIQPSSARVDTQQIVSHALFSDAAVAVVVIPGGRPGYAVREVVSVTDTVHGRPHDLGGDRHRVPDGAVAAGAVRARATHVGGLVDDLLARHDLKRPDVDGLGGAPGRPAHPHRGGAGAGAAAGRALAASRETLAEHGNCSSPTVLLILDRLRRAPRRPGPGGDARLRSGPDPVRVPAAAHRGGVTPRLVTRFGRRRTGRRAGCWTQWVTGFGP